MIFQCCIDMAWLAWKEASFMLHSVGNDQTPTSKSTGSQDDVQLLKHQLQRLKAQMVSSSAAQEEEVIRLQQVRKGLEDLILNLKDKSESSVM